ncbi:Pex19 protein family-domain-containing protein [Podospora aff. communis PSN243]|uniref:Pex19 protein family-domain-containing protein n=1 Tax=Podospora aff. communis PSN243 TaxID=3040156 RepID=A0AAV9GVW4_9PEZI|nr:Pex19 protein family-domain-containing protein [Podospora aff. communis PSN243]
MATAAGDIGTAKEDVVHQTAAPLAQPEAKAPTVEDEDDVPDPDEDDLDDLDDMLEEFSATKIEGKAPEIPPGKPAAAATDPSIPEPKLEDILSDDEFAKQLQAGMADLLGEMESSPEMQAQFDSIFKELGAAAAETAGHAATNIPSPSAPPGAVPGAAAGAAAAEASFQETIKRTMERMQTSGDQATAAAAAEGSDDFLAELLKQMQAGGLEGEGNEEDFSKMLLGMMEQLTNKEILYEPMKELNDKFPEWFEKNKATTSEEDLKRYREQQALVKEIVAKFEEASYSDANAADREYIVDRMQKMQAAGSPPPDLVGDMPSTQDVLNMPDESCNPQ